jgi:hypothetical protein
VVPILLVALAPTPSVEGLFSINDFPQYVLEAEKSYRIPTRTLVGLDGKPVWCDVEQASGEPRLDKHTCNIIKKRARFAPAKWIDGTPSYALVRQPITWAVNQIPTGYTVDLELAVNKLPADETSPVMMALSIAVDEQGKSVSCTSSTPPPTNQLPKWSEDPALARLACSEMMKSWTFFVPKDAVGRPVRSIQNARVIIGELRK